MSKADNYSKAFVTDEFIATWPFIFEPQTMTDDSGNTKDSYSVKMLFGHNHKLDDDNELLSKESLQSLPAVKSIMDTVLEVIQRKHEKVKSISDAEKLGLKLPFSYGNEINEKRDMEDKETFDHLKNKIIILTKSKDTPAIRDASRKIILDSEEIYAGCYGRAIVTVGYYSFMEPKKNTEIKGVALYLVGFQKTRDGSKIESKLEVDVDKMFED